MGAIIIDAYDKLSIGNDLIEKDSVKVDAIQIDALENDALENDSVEDDAIENDTVENDALKNDAVENVADKKNAYDIFPREIWFQIASKLPIQEFVNMREVCQDFYHLMNENYFWKMRYRRDFPERFGQMERLRARGPAYAKRVMAKKLSGS
jgi:pentapeptide MXKDX repeat protein